MPTEHRRPTGTGSDATAISLRDVTKRYRGGGGITDVTLDVERGEVLGFLGPNGAGKSTTLRLLLDLIRPDRGTITVLGLDAQRDSIEVHRRTGYLPGELDLYERLTGREQLGHLASLRRADLGREIEELAARVQLDLDRPIRQLSRGNKQKVGLVGAFMARPELVVLDEPTSGLDPIIQREVRRLIEERVAEGATVLLSSHVLGEVSQVADRIAFVRDGRLAAVESIDDLHRRSAHDITVRTREPLPPGMIDRIPGARVVDVDGLVSRIALTGPIDPLVKALATCEVLDLAIGEPDLEDLFLSRYSEPTAAPPDGPPEGTPHVGA